MIDEQLGLAPLGEQTQNPKELFDVEEIEGKTELTAEQVHIIARLKALGYHLDAIFGIKMLNIFIKDFLTLQLSKDRLSRKEYVSAMQSENSIQNNSLLDKISLGGHPK